MLAKNDISNNKTVTVTNFLRMGLKKVHETFEHSYKLDALENLCFSRNVIIPPHLKIRNPAIGCEI
jgi:hypothetical protein